MALNISLLILRVVVGFYLMGHGAQKLFGWFGGKGFAASVGMLKSRGFKPAVFWALLGSVGEFGGGLLLALGLFTPLGAIGVFASMLMAVLKFHWSKGFWAAKGGYEYPLILAILGFVLGLLGPGSYSLDALFGIPLSTVPLFLIGAVGAIIVDIIGIVTSNSPQQNTTAAKQPAA